MDYSKCNFSLPIPLDFNIFCIPDQIGNKLNVTGIPESRFKLYPLFFFKYIQIQGKAIGVKLLELNFKIQLHGQKKGQRSKQTNK